MNAKFPKQTNKPALAFRFLLLLFTALLNFLPAYSQLYPAIDDAIEKKDLALATNLLQQKINGFMLARNADSLSNCILYVGKIEKEKSNADAAIKKVSAFVETIKTLNPSIPALVQSYIDAGDFYGSVSKNDLAYKTNKQAFDLGFNNYKNATAKLGTIQSNMGTYSQRMGNVSLSEQHQRQALQYLLNDQKAGHESLYTSYNNMGSILYYVSQLDSAIYFYDKALVALSKTEPLPVNRFYRPAVVQNNIAGVYSIQGKATKAVEAMQKCIINLKRFLATKEPHPKKTTAITFQLEATDNLAGIYKELGDYKKAYELLNYSYTQKQEKLENDDPAIFISQILIGQLHFATKEFTKSLEFLNSGLQKISKADGDYLFWQADACNTLALLHNEKKNVKQAALYYAKADSLYNASLQGAYDNIYLEFISNEALFHAGDKNSTTALAKANKAYDYAVANSGANTLTASAQLLNLSEVTYLSGNYSKSLQYSNQALAVVINITKQSGNALDSVKTELKKPKIILQKTKAQYAQLIKKDASTLQPLLTQLDEAMTILERRKSILTYATDISILMADQSELIAFIKKLNLDLFKASNDKGYLEKLIQLHESSVYNRIRSRLDKSEAKFANLPAAIFDKEKILKEAITKSLEGSGSHDAKMQAYIKAIKEWDDFRASLQKLSPVYFKMRYATIVKPLKEILPSIPAQTNVIRYFFIDKELLAFVADNKQHNIILLGQPLVKEQIENLTAFNLDALKTGVVLYDLYNALWAPLSKYLNQKNIIVIPDGVLYSLSFDLLTAEKISSFKELETKSNVAKYAISYNYSLFNITNNAKPYASGNSFVGFAPGFSDDLKQKFKTTATDSAKWDEGYFSLLPQPFATSLATKTHEWFGGNIYLNETSTKKAFEQNAGNHSIIHLGTHAEANNLSPEFSRLIFARNPSAPDEANSLYLPEIYNCNLNSELAVLTACESGQPGYQDGEGMISMAHAFNYAGSQSIVTGLWKIDEQASAILMEEFYKNLQKGMAKDEALRQAKIHYLQTADSRMLSPAYWAGMVLMGDTSAVDLKPKNAKGKWIWITGGIASLLVLLTLASKRKTFSSR